MKQQLMIDVLDTSTLNTVYTVAFYNTENLFDIFDDKKTHDNDLLPTADKRWTHKRYHDKLNKIAYVISNIGRKETGRHPVIVGLAEIENASVLQDLIISKHLNSCNYDFVHYESKDERGIDVALLYDKTHFKVETSEIFSLELYNDAGLPDYTRDILLVSGILNDTKVHIIVNHWASRREGKRETEHKRMAGSNKVATIISNLKLKDPEIKIIVMGDFNDNPLNKSIQRLVDAFSLYNPMESLRTYSRGSSKHKRQWFLFDQILFTSNLLVKTKNTLHFDQANIFDTAYLKLQNGKYKGSPFRTYVGKKYKGGYSDHFPVYAVFKIGDE